MNHRAGNAIVFILSITMIPCVQADVLKYAGIGRSAKRKIKPSSNRSLKRRKRNVLRRVQNPRRR